MAQLCGFHAARKSNKNNIEAGETKIVNRKTINGLEIMYLCSNLTLTVERS